MEKVEFIVKDSDCSSRQLTSDGQDLSGGGGEYFPSYRRLEQPRFTEPSIDDIEEETQPNRIKIEDGKSFLWVIDVGYTIVRAKTIRDEDHSMVFDLSGEVSLIQVVKPP